ncbi:MAG: hypothetical protein H0V66_14775 [Bdellovibrionales bacterium]|nr:hypothetical protein [Bdellovibrionales bacterium]
MKFLIACVLVLFSARILACSCSDYPLSPEKSIQEYIQNQYGHKIELNEHDLRWIAYYPSLDERLFWNSTRGTSCEGSGPNGEIMAHCARARKSDYLVVIAERNCQVVVRARSTFKKVEVKEVNSTCER